MRVDGPVLSESPPRGVTPGRVVQPAPTGAGVLHAREQVGRVESVAARSCPGGRRDRSGSSREALPKGMGKADGIESLRLQRETRKVAPPVAGLVDLRDRAFPARQDVRRLQLVVDQERAELAGSYRSSSTRSAPRSSPPPPARPARRCSAPRPHRSGWRKQPRPVERQDTSARMGRQRQSLERALLQVAKVGRSRARFWDDGREDDEIARRYRWPWTSARKRWPTPGECR